MSKAYMSSKEVISRRNQDGTVILMKLDEASLFYKIDGLAASIWAELEEPKTEAALTEHFSRLWPMRAESLGRDIPAFLSALESKGLLQESATSESPFRREPFLASGLQIETAPFGELREFNLEQIETEVLNESIYLDVFAGSDLRLKTDVEPIQDALSKISRLNGILFRWSDEAQPQSRQAGLIAQEVAAEMPELTRIDEASGRLAVNYPKLSSYLVEAMKELKSSVNEQDARIARLEARLRAQAEN